MNYKYDEENKIFFVEEEEVVVVELEDVKSWFATFEDVADELEREDICLPFDEVIREDDEFLQNVIDKVNKKCNVTNKYISEIAIKEFIGDLTPINTFKGDNMSEQTKQIKELVEERCNEIIRNGGEITDIIANEDLSVSIHFLDHMCDSYGGFRKIATVRLPKEEIKTKKETKGEYCPQCGNKIKKEHKFCPQCGTQIKEKVVQIPKEVLLNKIGQINGIEVIGDRIMIPRYQEEITEELIKLGKKTGHTIEEDLSLGSVTVLICKD